MSKPKVQVHVYRNREYIGKYQSIVEAGQRAGITPATVRQILLGNQECTRQGYYFAYDKLSDEEVDELPIRDTMPSKEGMVRHDGRSCRKLVEESVYEVDCANPQVFYQPRSRKEKIDEFLDKQIGKNKLPIQVDDFSKLPHIGLEWNDWLLYSIVNKWSKDFKAVTTNTKFAMAEPRFARK